MKYGAKILYKNSVGRFFSLSLNLPKQALLYESRVVTNNDIKRVVFLLPLKELLHFIRYAQSNGITVEHIFNY